MKNKIKEVIRERGMTQKQLCEITGMSEAGLSKAINGSATRETISKVAEVLGVDVEKLTDEGLYAKFSAEKTPLSFGKILVPCYVLNNGMRVFSGRGMQKAIGAGVKTSGQWLRVFVNSESIAPYFSAGILEKFNSPIEFRRNDAGGSQRLTYGYEATLLVDLCDAIIDAFNDRRNGVSEEYFAAANVILRSVAKVGIIALVDEATGYNKEKTRAKDELQRFLSTFINKEAERWVKTFDDSFFEDIYRMRNWTWEKTIKKPSFVGRIINDIVYERIAPVVLSELQRLNPKNESGNRKYKYHQFLTSDVGKPTLQKHLHTLHTLAIVSDYKWGKFMAMLDKACPKQYQQLSLFDDIDID